MPVQHRCALVVAATLTFGCASRPVVPGGTSGAAPPPITTGTQLLEAMHARYAGRHLRTLSFLQNNTLYSAAGGEQHSQWLEHLSAPGRLRIDHLPLSSHSGVLYTGGKVFAFDNGRQTQSQPGVNPLLLLGFDVHAQPPAQTAQTIDSLGFDVDVLHEGQWQGRRTWIVGAAPGDTTANQFWVDAERLLFVRMLQRNPSGSVITEVRFDRYTDFEGIPIAIEVSMRRNGRLYFKEEYTNVRVNVPIPEAVFDPARWTEAQPAIAPPPAPRDAISAAAATPHR